MLIKSKVVAAAAVLSLAGGLGTLAAVAASAATPQCGASCIEVYSAKYATPTSLGCVETVLLGDPAARRANEVRPASSSNPAEDLIVPPGAGKVPAVRPGHGVGRGRQRTTANEYAVQIEYAPYGKATGLCTAVAVTAYQDEALSLQPCSTPGTTVWIIDINDSSATAAPSRSSTGRTPTSSTRSR